MACFRFVHLSLVLLLLSCAACVSSTTHRIANGVDISAYRYITWDDSGDEWGVSIELEDLLSGMGFDVLDSFQYAKLPTSEHGKVLVLNVRTYAGTYRTRIRIKLVDDYTGRVVYRGESDYGMGILGPQDQAMHGVREALQGLFEQYEGFDPQAKARMAGLDVDNYRQLSREQAVSYLDENEGALNPIEGIWSELKNGVVLAIMRDEVPGKRDYAAIILDPGNLSLARGAIYFDIARSARPDFFTAYVNWGEKGRSGGTLRIGKTGMMEGVFSRPADAKTIEIDFLRNYPLGGRSGGERGQGSGFFIGDSGLVVTNHHVVTPRGKVRVYIPALDESYPAKVVAEDKRNDLAVLSLKSWPKIRKKLGPVPYSIDMQNTGKVGESVFSIGFPWGTTLGNSCKMTTGIINALNGMNGDPTQLQISSPIQPGNSGGPLFTHDGELVGVVVSMMVSRYYTENYGISPQNVNFAVKVSYLREMIAMVESNRFEPDTERSVSLPAAFSTEDGTASGSFAPSLPDIFDRYSRFMVQVRLYGGKKSVKPSAIIKDTRTSTGTPVPAKPQSLF